MVLSRLPQEKVTLTWVLGSYNTTVSCSACYHTQSCYTKQSHSILLDSVPSASVFGSNKHVLSSNTVNHLHPGINKKCWTVFIGNILKWSLCMNMGIWISRVPVLQLQCTIPSTIAPMNGYKGCRISSDLIIIRESCFSTNFSKKTECALSSLSSPYWQGTIVNWCSAK